VSIVLFAALLLIGKAADNRQAPAIKPVVSFFNITIRYIYYALSKYEYKC